MDDVRVRLAAFQWLQDQIRLHGDEMRAETLRIGFQLDGERVPLMGPSGIWKPKVIEALPLSITTTWDNPYQDRVGVDDVFIYSFRRGEHAQNDYLIRAARQHTPLIYFHAVGKALYNALFPVFIVHVDVHAREIRVQVGDALQPYAYGRTAGLAASTGMADRGPDPVRSYLTVQAKVRLHQRFFANASWQPTHVAAPAAASATRRCWMPPTSFRMPTSRESRSSPMGFPSARSTTGPTITP
jgi:putative restriction endonuclease